MASRWIRWNTTSHIYEFSTNFGSSWGALPLDASILNEGTLADARLSANVPLLNAANIFTNAAPISIQNATPYLELKETDQGADLKFWRVEAEGAVFRIQKLTDALASTDLITADRNGYLTISNQAAGAHAINGNFNGDLSFGLRNSSAGAAARSILGIGNDSAINRASITEHSSGFTTANVAVADGLLIQNLGAGGINIYSNNASGAFNIFTGASTSARFNIDSAGVININAGFTANAGQMKVSVPSSSASIIVQKRSAAVSGSPEGGLVFAGTGITHAALMYTPQTVGSYLGILNGSTLDPVSNAPKTEFYDDITLADTATFDFHGGARLSVLILTMSSDNAMAMYLCRGGTGATVELLDPQTLFTNTLGTAASFNIGWNAGTSSYRLENKRGASRTVSVVRFCYQ